MIAQRARRIAAIGVLTTLLWAAFADAATGGAATASLNPNTIAAASSATISITGLPGGLPNSIELLLQKGFSANARSVSVLCTSTEASNDDCPSASRIGSGSAAITLLGAGPPTLAPLMLFLGQPLHAGDIASVILEITFDGADVSVPARLFVPAQGGLELLISSFPAAPVTLNALTLTLGATQTATRTVTHRVSRTITIGKGKHRHKHRIRKTVKRKVKVIDSLITNPPTCAGAWTGTVTMDYKNGPDTLPLTAPCSTTNPSAGRLRSTPRAATP